MIGGANSYWLLVLLTVLQGTILSSYCSPAENEGSPSSQAVGVEVPVNTLLACSGHGTSGHTFTLLLPQSSGEPYEETKKN